MKFDINDLNQLPESGWFDDPPEWFRYFVLRLAAGDRAGDVEDALEKISPWGVAPDWYREATQS
jgi:hypothetical protein